MGSQNNKSEIYIEPVDIDSKRRAIRSLTVGDFFCFASCSESKTVWVLWDKVLHSDDNDYCFKCRDIQTGEISYIHNKNSDVLLLNAKIRCQLA